MLLNPMVSALWRERQLFHLHVVSEGRQSRQPATKHICVKEPNFLIKLIKSGKEFPLEIQSSYTSRPVLVMNIPQSGLIHCSILFSVTLTSNKNLFNLKYKIELGLEKHNKHGLMPECLLYLNCAVYGYEHFIKFQVKPPVIFRVDRGAFLQLMHMFISYWFWINRE